MTMLFTKIASIALLLGATFTTSCARGEEVVKQMVHSSEQGLKDFPAYSSKIVSSNMPVPAFNSIAVDICSNIVFVQSDGEYSIRATGHMDDPLRYLDIKVENGVLRISRREAEGGVIRKSGVTRFIDQYITIYISGKQLAGLNMAGTADFFCQELSQTTPCNVIMRGTGDININDISLDKLTVNLHGTGDFKSDRTNASECNLTLSGTGDIEIKSLVSTSLSTTLVGTGDFELPSITAAEMSAVLSGTGDMELEGKCSGVASFSVSGTGDLKAKKLLADKISAVVTGPGSLECSPVSSITATRTFGDLTYYGSPKSVKISGSVRNSK